MERIEDDEVASKVCGIIRQIVARVSSSDRGCVQKIKTNTSTPQVVSYFLPLRLFSSTFTSTILLHLFLNPPCDCMPDTSWTLTWKERRPPRMSPTDRKPFTSCGGFPLSLTPVFELFRFLDPSPLLLFFVAFLLSFLLFFSDRRPLELDKTITSISSRSCFKKILSGF